MKIVEAIVELTLTAAPWLVAGLLMAGLVRALVPTNQLQRLVGGDGFAGISRAAVIGAPLPLCSCGAIPTAIALHRGGAGRGPTTAFLIGTPGIGVDSLAISYALLGPFMMLARATSAVATAISTGITVALTGADRRPATQAATSTPCNAGCNEDCGADPNRTAANRERASLGARLSDGMHYAFVDILDDIAPWLAVGLLLAGVLTGLTTAETLAGIGSGVWPMLLMAVIGIPLYICATAATPIAAGMLLAGVSPGTALVFLVAGPVTSLATLGVLRREFGVRALTGYLASIIVTTVLLGLATDGLIAGTGLNVAAQSGTAGELLPVWIQVAAALALLTLGIRPLRQRLAGMTLHPGR